MNTQMEKDLARLKDLADNLALLMKNPEPGISSWVQWLGRTISEIGEIALCCGALKWEEAHARALAKAENLGE